MITLSDGSNVVIAITSVITLFVTLRNMRQIGRVEKATNSMKDALVAGASREGVTEGLRQGAEAAAAAAAAAKKP